MSNPYREPASVSKPDGGPLDQKALDAHERVMKRVTFKDDGSAVVALSSPVTQKRAKGAEVTMASLTFTKFKVKHLRRVDPSIFGGEDGEGKIDLATAIEIASMLCTESWAVDEVDNTDDLEAITAVVGELMGKFLPPEG